MREITSATNPFVKQLRALATSKKARLDSSRFIIEGWRGIETLLNHESRQNRLETLVISPEWQNRNEIKRLVGTAVPAVQGGLGTARPTPLEVIVLPDHLFEKVSDVKNAQGILAVVRHTPLPFTVPGTGNLLLLDNLRDPGNLGTLIRSAVGAGFNGILLYGDCVEPYNPKVVRSTMGTFAFCNLWSVGDAEITQLQEAGFDLCVTTGVGGQNLYDTQFGDKTILAIGSEAHGVSDALMQRASKKITIHLQPECESLNAAIAGSICMFQIARGK